MLATVAGINPPERTVALRYADGRTESLHLGPDVRNFAQIRVGDEVVVRYREAVAVALSESGAAPTEPVSTTAVTREPLGARPGLETTTSVASRVRIEAIDGAGPTVTFSDNDGQRRTVTPNTPEMQAFARALRPGDVVDVTFTDAVALSVEPARRRPLRSLYARNQDSSR